MTVDDPTLTIARLCRVLECNTAAGLTLPQYRVLGLLAGGDERASCWPVESRLPSRR